MKLLNKKAMHKLYIYFAWSIIELNIFSTFCTTSPISSSLFHVLCSHHYGIPWSFPVDSVLGWLNAWSVSWNLTLSFMPHTRMHTHIHTYTYMHAHIYICSLGSIHSGNQGLLLFLCLGNTESDPLLSDFNQYNTL